MAISNIQIANIFTDMAALLEIKGESVFKIRAYQRAANTIENLQESLEGLVLSNSDLKQISSSLRCLFSPESINESQKV